MWNNEKLGRLCLPELQQLGNNFLCVNTELVQLILPKLKYVGNNFLCNTEKLSRLELPELQKIGDNCLLYNESLVYVVIPKLPFLEKRILENSRNLMMENNSGNISMSDIAKNALSQGVTLEQVETVSRNIEIEDLGRVENL